jgi:hypothetical protein
MTVKRMFMTTSKQRIGNAARRRRPIRHLPSAPAMLERGHLNVTKVKAPKPKMMKNVLTIHIQSLVRRM